MLLSAAVVQRLVVLVRVVRAADPGDEAIEIAAHSD